MKKYLKKEENIEKVSVVKNIKELFFKYKIYVFYLVVVILSITSIVIQAVDRKNTLQVNSNIVKGKNEKIAVYITGAVKNPGVYYLEENSRLSNLLDICGGIESNADIEQINLAKKLVDSDKINIPVKQEKSEDKILDSDNSKEKENEKSSKSKVNINSASKEELMILNGIGESTATKIIEYRKTQKFLEIEDIMNVSGIGNSKFDKIKDNIEVD